MGPQLSALYTTNAKIYIYTHTGLYINNVNTPYVDFFI